MTLYAHTAKESAIAVIDKLRQQGAIALLAGGCVRDELLGLTPKDYDVATDALPAQVRKCFPRAREVGAQFGVILVRKYSYDIEVATFRSDGEYLDGRRPENVEFATAKEDAQRRDFTINGLFFDTEKNEVIDYVGGQKDLRNKLLRTIGEPVQRFSEDHLRLLRAVRFAARLGFEIHPDTLSQIKQLAPKLRIISAERIAMELEAILVAPSRSSGWQWLMDTGLRGHLANSWTDDVPADKAALSRLSFLPDQVISTSLSFAAIFCDISSSSIKRICHDLRLSNRVASNISWLIDSLPEAAKSGQLELADLKLLMAHKCWPELLLLVNANERAGGHSTSVYDKLIENTRDIKTSAVAPPPLLTGDDLKTLGINSGPEMGKLLSALYREQLNETIETRAQALVWLDVALKD